MVTFTIASRTLRLAMSRPLAGLDGSGANRQLLLETTLVTVENAAIAAGFESVADRSSNRFPPA
jgi:hypothetical protein